MAWRTIITEMDGEEDEIRYDEWDFDSPEEEAEFCRRASEAMTKYGF